MHGDRPCLARVDHRDAQCQPGHESGRDPADLGRDNLVGAEVRKARRQCPTYGEHQGRVHLVVDETVHLEDPMTQIDALTHDSFFEYFHTSTSSPSAACLASLWLNIVAPKGRKRK